MSKQRKIIIHRSSVTGRTVTETEAQRNPRETVTERRYVPAKPPKPKKK